MAGGGAPPKADDFQPHAVKEQLPGVDFCMTSSPPWPEAILLGFQHFVVMLGTTVFIPTLLVPIMGGGNVEKAQVIDAGRKLVERVAKTDGRNVREMIQTERLRATDRGDRKRGLREPFTRIARRKFSDGNDPFEQ